MEELISRLIKPVLAADDIIGTIALPSGIPGSTATGGVAGTGAFLSNIIRAIIIVAGLYTLFQFLLGGFALISSNGDKAKISEGTQKIQMSIVGMIVIAASFVIIAIVSQLLFGSFTYILIPKLQTVTPAP